MKCGAIGARFWNAFTAIALCWGVALAADLRAQEPVEAEKPMPEKPEAELSGFDLVDAYHLKLRRLETFQSEHRLLETDLHPRSSRAADELHRLMGGLRLLMSQQAEQIYKQAMAADDAEVRDGMLKRLASVEFPVDEVRNRARREIEERSVGGMLYPTIEVAKAKQRERREQQQKAQDEQDLLDLEDLEKLKQQDKNKSVSQAADLYASEHAGAMLKTAMRLVQSQRRALLQEVVRIYPHTSAGQKSNAILAAIQQQSDWVANHKLQQAMHAPLIYDQRWRRLKEILRDYPNTPAAIEAEQIFQQHLAQVPPTTVTNGTAKTLDMTIDKPYGKLVKFTLSPGDMRSVHAAFPLRVRIKVAEHDWDDYRAWAGGNYTVKTLQDGVPVLHHAP